MTTTERLKSSVSAELFDVRGLGVFGADGDALVGDEEDAAGVVG